MVRWGTGDHNFRRRQNPQDDAMSRFFKSAAFPILIVVVLAFLAVKLVNPGSSTHRTHSYETLVAKELPQHEVKSVEFKNKGKSLEVKLDNKESYEIGYIDQAAPELIKELRAAGVRSEEHTS